MVDSFYAFANHASPMLCWREEQNPKGEKYDACGDMPHNWASAEFIRMTRHMLVLERGKQLHLLEGLPSGWTQPGSKTELSKMPTSFGPMDLSLEVAKDGKSATLTVDPPRRNRPKKIVVHLEHFANPVGTLKMADRELTDGAISIPTDKPFTLDIVFER